MIMYTTLQDCTLLLCWLLTLACKSLAHSSAVSACPLFHPAVFGVFERLMPAAAKLTSVVAYHAKFCRTIDLHRVSQSWYDQCPQKPGVHEEPYVK